MYKRKRSIGVVFSLSTVCTIMSFSLTAGTGENICYNGVNCALGPSKSIRYSGDFIIAGFVIAEFLALP